MRIVHPLSIQIVFCFHEDRFEGVLGEQEMGVSWAFQSDERQGCVVCPAIADRLTLLSSSLYLQLQGSRQVVSALHLSSLLETSALEHKKSMPQLSLGLRHRRRETVRLLLAVLAILGFVQGWGNRLARNKHVHI